jgi:hypothetical protein
LGGLWIFLARSADLRPGGALGHLHAGLVGQVLAVHQHRAFAVERGGKQLAVHAQAVAHGGQQVVHVVGGIGLQRLQPALLAPDRRFVHADGHHVELAALGGDVGGHALAQHAFFQRHPLELDVRVGLLEVLRELLHLDHVTVVHGGDHQFGGRMGHAGRQTEGQCQGSLEFHHRSLLTQGGTGGTGKRKTKGSVGSGCVPVGSARDSTVATIGVLSCWFRYKSRLSMYSIASISWDIP